MIRIAVFMLVVASSAGAQLPAATDSTPAVAVNDRSAQTTVGAIVGAALGGTLGAFGALGLAVGECGDTEECLGPVIQAFLFGAGAGTALGSSIGAHYGNLKRGNLKASLAITGAELAVGVAAMAISLRHDSGNGTGQIAVAVPLLHVFSAVWMELRTTRR
jgi:hypothetical protein